MGVVAVVLSVALLVPAASAALDAAGRITRVTVHPDRAEVTRSAEMRVPAGASEVRFSGLPENLDADSLTVGARGVPAVIGTVELRTESRQATTCRTPCRASPTSRPTQPSIA